MLIGCVTTTGPIEEKYQGAKTNFQDVVLLKNVSIERAKNIVLLALSEYKFRVTQNDNYQNLIVAKKEAGLSNTYITTSIYFFKVSGGVNIRVSSNAPINSSKAYDFHTRLLNSFKGNTF